MKAYKHYIYIFLVFCVSSESIANNKIQLEIAKQVSSGCINTIKEVEKKITPLLKEYPDLKNQNNLILFGPNGEFNAITFYRHKKILITKGLCDQLWLAASGMAFLQEGYGNIHQFQRYITYISNKAIEAEKLGAGFHSYEVLTFPLYANINLEKIKKSQFNKITFLIQDIMFSSLAFIIGHEIGHLVLEHSPSAYIDSSTSKNQEFEADKFGLDMIEDLGISPIGTIPTMTIFLSRESQIKRDKKSSHPKPECRIQKILTSSKEFNDLVNDPASEEQLVKFTGYNLEEYLQIMNELGEYCIRS